MRSHYGFESLFCLSGIGGAHEKGGVEGEMTELKKLLLAGALVDDRRHIAHWRITVGEHLDLEAPLPMEAFDVSVVGSNRVDTKSRARPSGVFTPTDERFWNLARRRLGDVAGTRSMVEVFLAHRTMTADAVVAGTTGPRPTDSVDAQVVVIEARRSAEGANARSLR